MAVLNWTYTAEDVRKINEDLGFFLTTDLSVVSGKTYYYYNSVTHTYSKVDHPTGNPKAAGYYEFDIGAVEQHIMWFETDWSDDPFASMISNGVEVGPPIRRFRSRNIRHDVTASTTLSYWDFNNIFKKFIEKIGFGLYPFGFKPFICSEKEDGSPNFVDAYLSDISKPYTIKRKDENSYTVTISFYYIEIGGIK